MTGDCQFAQENVKIMRLIFKVTTSVAISVIHLSLWWAQREEKRMGSASWLRCDICAVQWSQDVQQS